MPNWQIGDLKVRGKMVDIQRFIKDRFSQTDYGYWLNGIRRSYLDGDDFAQIRWNIETIQDQGYEPDDKVVLVLPELHNAWGITDEIAAQWAVLSAEFNVDFRFYGFESGMQFEEEMEVVAGKVTILREIKYDNYDWESMRPLIGG